MKCEENIRNNVRVSHHHDFSRSAACTMLKEAQDTHWDRGINDVSRRKEVFSLLEGTTEMSSSFSSSSQSLWLSSCLILESNCGLWRNVLKLKGQNFALSLSCPSILPRYYYGHFFLSPRQVGWMDGWSKSNVLKSLRGLWICESSDNPITSKLVPVNFSGAKDELAPRARRWDYLSLDNLRTSQSQPLCIDFKFWTGKSIFDFANSICLG